MVEGQKKRQVGKGMKPRGNKRFRTQKETNKVTNQSTNEGQERGAPEPILEAEVRNETPGNLEPENGENSLQNLENSEAIVAHDEGLEAALKESGASEEPQFTAQPIPGREFSDLMWPSLDQIARAIYENGKPQAGVDLETAMAVGTGTVKDLQPLRNESSIGSRPTIADLEEAINEKRRVEVKPNGGVEIGPRIGLQPDGSYGVVVTIQEGYWEAVQQWAEADGLLVERWLSDRLYEYISTYGEPAKGR